MKSRSFIFKLLFLNGLFFSFLAGLPAQGVAVGHWRTHFAPSAILGMAQRDVDVFGLMETGLVYVDTRDDILYEFNRNQGLSSVGLSSLAYGPLYDALVVGYSDGMLDLVFCFGFDL